MRTILTTVIITLIISAYTKNSFAQVPSYVPDSGLVAWYPFNGNANDESGNNLHAIFITGTFQNDRYGTANSSLYINGSQMIGVPTDSSILYGDTFSIALWNLPISFNFHNKVTCGIIGNPLSWVMNWGPLYGIQGDHMVYHPFNCNTYAPNANGTVSNIPTGIWHHLAFIIEGNKTTFYLDGQIAGTDSNASSRTCFDPNMNIYFGGDIGGGAIEYHNGYFDDIGIWKRALSQSEIAELYAPCLAPAPVVNNVTLCNPGTVTLTASGGTNYKWYDVPNGGIVLGSGSSFNTPYLTVSDTFWVSAFDSCESIRVPAIVTVLSPQYQPTISFLPVWQNSYSSVNCIFRKAILDNDSLVISGSTWPSWPSGKTDQLITKISPNGNLVWQYVRSPGPDHDGYMAVCAPDNGNYVFFGQQNGQGTLYFDAAWGVFNRNGTEISYGYFPVSGSSSGTDIKKLSNGNIVYTGNHSGGQNFVALTDQNFQQLAYDIYYAGGWNHPLLAIDTINNIIFNICGVPSTAVPIRIYNDTLGLLSSHTITNSNPITIVDAEFLNNNLHMCGYISVSGIMHGVIFKMSSSGIILDSYISSDNSIYTAITNHGSEIIVAKSHISGALSQYNEILEYNGNGSFGTSYILNNNQPFVVSELLCSLDYIYIVGVTGTGDGVGIPTVAKISVQSQSNCPTSPPIASGTTICGPGEAIIRASGGANYLWYHDSVGGNVIDTGAVFTIPYVAASDTFWVSNLDCCESERVPAIVTMLPHIVQVDCTILIGDTIKLSFSDNLDPISSSIGSYSASFSNGWLYSFPTRIGFKYELVVSGLYSIGSHCPQFALDPAYSLLGSNPFTQFNPNCQLLYSQSEGWFLKDFCPIRPSPDSYNSSHVYSYFFTAIDTLSSIGFYDECCYWDNCGQLHFQLYEINPNYSFIWSTGDTTPYITVSPTQTTTYYVTVSDDYYQCVDSVTITVLTDSIYTKASVKVLLQGAWNGADSMHTFLNTAGYMPNAQPYGTFPWYYSGQEQLSVIPTNMTDWVLIELRDAIDTIIARRAAVLLSDGMIRDTNGLPGVLFDVPSGDYYIAVHHRNHIPIMSRSKVSIPNQNTYDFTDTLRFPIYGNCVIDVTSGISAMISGDLNHDGQLKYSGSSNDRSLVLQKILSIVGGTSITATTTGYHKEDLNMNGQVKYSGAGNDPSLIIQNIVSLTGSNAITGVFNGCVPPGIIVEPTPLWACGTTLTDTRDGQQYPTVQIGTQCWMAKNLNIGTMVSGSSNQTNNSTIEKYCYNNDANNCATYGGLYQWDEMMGYTTTPGTQGICPTGWHIPTDAEWCTLTTFLDATVNCNTWGWSGTDAGGKMKATGTTHWLSPNTGATNSSGFTALGAGYRGDNGGFTNLGANAHFWSSSEYSSYGLYRSLSYATAHVYRYYHYATFGFSVRCLRDSIPPCTPQPDQADAGPDSLGVLADSIILSANLPAYASGLWNIITGNGGSFSDSTSPSAIFYGQPCTSYTLSWTIYNGYCSNSDSVVISFLFYPGNPLNQCMSAYYLMNGNAVDSSGNNRHGVLTGPVPSTDRYGQSGMALLFDGSDDKLYVGNHSVLDLGQEQYTICGWFNIHNVQQSMQCIFNTNPHTGIGIGYNHNVHASYHLSYWIGNGSGWTQSLTGTKSDYQDSTWYFITMVKNGTSYKFYVDCLLDYSTVVPEALQYSQTAGVNFGYIDLGGGAEFFSGKLDEFRIYNRALTLSEIQQLFNICQPQSDQANAGPDSLNISGITYQVQANQPANGTGLWTILSGTGGSLADSALYNTLFTGQVGNAYSLIWTISNPCGSTRDTVNIGFAASQTFTCGATLTDTRDGQQYPTVQIGTQCWMAKNLNVGTMVSGLSNQTNNSTIEKYCFNNDANNCAIYGGLYQWNEMMSYTTTPGTQGICPTGWHIPTDAEWCTLTTYLDATVNCNTWGWSGTNAGGKMKATGTTHWNSPNTGATNSSGFTALGAGGRGYSGSFSGLRYGAYFWSSSEYSSALGIYRTLGYDYAGVYRDINYKTLGYSVRCLRNN